MGTVRAVLGRVRAAERFMRYCDEMGNTQIRRQPVNGPSVSLQERLARFGSRGIA